ncbi:hypothetical protein HBA_0680 [Sodalis endosymbiont of Henestaris halophilus]|nr:hypothetical protein HBA_0680 [Sodalis endosymbiont of Henestaris halophilus]
MLNHEYKQAGYEYLKIPDFSTAAAILIELIMVFIVTKYC